MIRVRPIFLDPVDGRIAHDDYATISAWWRARGANPPARNILPTLGIIAESAGCPLAATFAYLDATGSGVAWTGWMISDPSSPPASAGRAMFRATEFLEQECQRLGYWIAWATVANPSLIQFLEHRRYTPTDTGLCHLFKPIAGSPLASSPNGS